MCVWSMNCFMMLFVGGKRGMREERMDSVGGGECGVFVGG